MSLFSRVSAEEERNFERENVLEKRASYLSSNPMDRLIADSTYADKIDQLDSGLRQGGVEPGRGWILDLGGNTGGESTILHQRGFNMLISDINEVALEVGLARAAKYDLKEPYCVAADVHQLPFADNTFSAVMVIEALHHFEKYDQALSEINRVLKPGGLLMSVEPIGWNPIRRMSELRDRFRGTIEKSFTQGQLEKLLRRAGLTKVKIKSVPGGRSALRMADVPRYRRGLARLHAHLQRNYPRFFGSYQIWAYKPDRFSSSEGSDQVPRWPSFLRTPGGARILTEEAGIWRAGNTGYPSCGVVPVLIEEDIIQLPKDGTK